MQTERILELLFATVDEVNETLDPDEAIAKDPGAPLMGEGGTLDSLGFVNLIVGVEERVNAEFDADLALAADLMSEEDAEPPESLRALAGEIARLLEAEGDG